MFEILSILQKIKALKINVVNYYLVVRSVTRTHPYKYVKRPGQKYLRLIHMTSTSDFFLWILNICAVFGYTVWLWACLVQVVINFENHRGAFLSHLIICASLHLIVSIHSIVLLFEREQFRTLMNTYFGFCERHDRKIFSLYS